MHHKKKKNFLDIIILACILAVAAILFQIMAWNTQEVTLSINTDHWEDGKLVTASLEGGFPSEVVYTWYLDDTKIESDDSKLSDGGQAYQLDSSDLEKMLKVKAVRGGKEYETEIYLSKLPVISITYGGNGVGDEDYTQCEFSMQGTENYGLGKNNSYSGDAQIKLRGNSTRYRLKAPYNIKLGKSTNLLGLGKSKHWVLLADDIDHTLVRNKLILDLARDIGMENASDCTKVDLLVNGNYMGCYTLCEQVRIGSDQVDIYDYGDLAEELVEKIALKMSEEELEELDVETFTNYLKADFSWLSEPYEFTYKDVTYTATDYVTIPNLTGGFLLEQDFYHSGSSNNSLQTAYLQPLYFSSPARLYTNAEIKDYAYKYFQAFEYAIHSEDFTYHDSDTHYAVEEHGKFSMTTGWSAKEYETDFSAPEYDGWEYSDFVDMDSLVDYFLVTEISRNWDSMKNSVFLYKDVDEKAYIGPVWDYDWSLGNINMYNINTYYPTGWQTTDYYFTREQQYQEYNWYRYLIKDPDFVHAVYEKWEEIRPTVIEQLITENGKLDTLEEALKEAGQANDEKWQFTYDEYHSMDYEDSWESLREFLTERIEWMDEQFEDEDTLYESLNSYEQAETTGDKRGSH